MTDRQTIEFILNRLNQDNQRIVYQDANRIEINNSCVGEDIVFIFDNDENLLSVEC